MERHEILEAMSELKPYGMRASLDDAGWQAAWPGAMRFIRLSPA